MRAALTWWSAATFVFLWVGLLVVVVADRGGVEAVDEWFDQRSVAVRALLWVLLLPVVVGMKAWTSPSTTVRAVGVVAIVIWTAASATSLVRLLNDSP